MTVHAIERAKERYGLTLNALDIRAVVKQIMDGKSLLTKREVRERHQVEHHALKYKDTIMACIYNPHIKTIITFLPIEAILAGNQARRIKYRRDK